jgi:hypothetical protein
LWRQGREKREEKNKGIQEGNTEEDKRKIGTDSWKTGISKIIRTRVKMVI